jgi:hypothetical protein
MAKSTLPASPIAFTLTFSACGDRLAGIRSAGRHRNRIGDQPHQDRPAHPRERHLRRGHVHPVTVNRRRFTPLGLLNPKTEADSATDYAAWDLATDYTVQMQWVKISDALKFCHEKVRTVIPNNLLKICEIGGICGSNFRIWA